MTKERVKDQIAKQLPELQLDEAALEEITNQIYINKK